MQVRWPGWRSNLKVEDLQGILYGCATQYQREFVAGRHSWKTASVGSWPVRRAVIVHHFLRLYCYFHLRGFLGESIQSLKINFLYSDQMKFSFIYAHSLGIQFGDQHSGQLRSIDPGIKPF